VPIFVGGTGLYFRALVEGLSDIPPVSDAIRAELRAWAEGSAAHEIHARLQNLDPETAATLRPTDPQRNLRALEIIMATGRSLASFHKDRKGALLDAGTCVAVFLSPDRDGLRRRINDRFDQMIETGAIDEVEALRERMLDPSLPAMRAHGVPAIIESLSGRVSLADAVEIGKSDTRRYAKRQHTWFRHQAPWFRWVEPESAYDTIFCEFA
jgi:tRNA dimethylallyltransferase